MKIALKNPFRMKHRETNEYTNKKKEIVRRLNIYLFRIPKGEAKAM